jgi:hypothetical protein
MAMTMTGVDIDGGKRFIKSLPEDTENVARAEALFSLLRDAIHSPWAHKTVIAVYHLAGSGEWEIGSHDLNMITMALTHNLDLLPLVQDDVNRVFQRYGLIERRARTTWDYVTRMFSAKKEAQCV